MLPSLYNITYVLAHARPTMRCIHLVYLEAYGYLYSGNIAHAEGMSKCNWASVSEPHTSVFNGEFVCAYGVRTYVRTYRISFRVSI